MAVQINISDASLMTQREIEALQAMLSALGGADTSQEAPVSIKHVTCSNGPLRGLTASQFIIDELPQQSTRIDEQLEEIAKAVGVPAHYLTGAGAEVMVEHVAAVPIPDTDTPFPMEDDIRPTENTIDFAALFGGTSSERDINGLPWDARIHAATKAKIADGSWRKRRNLDEAEEAAVVAELKQIVNAPAMPVSVAPVAPAPSRVSAAADVVESGWNKMLDEGTVTKAQHADKLEELAAVRTFKEFMPLATGMLTRGELTQQQLASIAVAVGLPHIIALKEREDLIPAVMQRVDGILNGGV